VWLGAPLLLYVGTLAAPFQLDDLNLILKAERYQRGERPTLSLYAWAPNEAEVQEMANRGTCPWWVWTGIRVSFFRPLAELAFYADVVMFGRNPVAHRLVSFCWFIAALLCVQKLYRTVSGDDTFAGAATLLFGISQTLAAPVAFVCNRADLFVVIGTSLAAWAYWSAGTRPEWRLGCIAAVAYAFALLSKEAAVPLVAVFLGHEILARWRGWPVRGGNFRTWLVVVLVAVLGAYLVFYLTTRPLVASLSRNWGETISFFGLLFPRSLGLYLCVWTTGFPVNILSESEKLWPGNLLAVIGGLLALPVLWYLFRALSRNVGLAFFMLWSGMFVCLALLTVPEPRALSLATVGWAYLLTELLLPRDDGASPAPNFLRHWLLTANGLVSILCIVASIFMGSAMEKQAQGWLRDYIASGGRSMRDGDVLVIGESRTPVEVLFAGDRLEYVTGLPHVSIAYLTIKGAGATFHRVDEHTLTATAHSPLLFESRFHKMLLEPNYKLTVGRQFRARAFTAEIAAMEDGMVTQLRFRFDEPLTSPRYHFYPPSLAAVAQGK